MYAALVLGDGNTLHAMHSRLPAHGAVCAVTLHFEYRFLHSAERSIGLRYYFDTPAAALGEARIHSKKIGGKDRGFVAAGTASYLDDCRPVVEWIVRNERGLYLFVQSGNGFLQTRCFGFCFLRHLGVIRIGQLAGLSELLL